MAWEACKHCNETGQVRLKYPPGHNLAAMMYKQHTGRDWGGGEMEVEINCGWCFGDGTVLGPDRQCDCHQ